MPLLPNRAHDIPFGLVNGLNGAVLTGASPTGYRVLNGGVQAGVSGGIVEKGGGQYLLEGLAADFNASQSIGLLFTATNAIPAHVLIQVEHFKRDTAYNIPFLMTNLSNGGGLTGVSPAGVRCLDGGAQSGVAGPFVERGNGQYVFQATAGDFGATDVVGFMITAANALPVHLVINLMLAQAESDTLGDSPASVLQTWAVGAGYGTLPSSGSTWPIYVANLPDGDDVEDDAIRLADSTPIKDGRLMEGPIVQHYGVHLTVRSRDRDDGWDKINTISSAMDAVHLATVTRNSVDYLLENISRNPVNFLGLEPQSTKRRFQHTADLLVTMKQI